MTPSPKGEGFGYIAFGNENKKEMELGECSKGQNLKEAV